MTTKSKPAATAQAKHTGNRPTLRVWLVTDAPHPDTGEVKPMWTEVTGLWPTKTGSGYSGALTKPVQFTTGRLVVLPAHVGHPAGQPTA
jgi:hypothetical protein